MNPLKQLKTSSFLVLSGLLLLGCKKESEEIEFASPTVYLPAQTGKFITYRLDSTVYVNFGANAEVRSYQEKHQVDAQISDNLGRPAYRVFRYLRDTAGATAWKPSGSYFITAVGNTVEVVENNLRFVKLAGPVKEGLAWKGNLYLPHDAYGNFYDFGNDDNDQLSLWEYHYTETGGTANYGGKQYSNVATVLHIDESQNAPLRDPLQFGFRNYATEQYAKDLGLIYQEVVMWEYQPPSTPRPGFRGFGVKRTVIDHN